MPKITKADQKYIRERELVELFNKWMDGGTELYGWVWFHCHQQVVSELRRTGFDLEDKTVKAISAIIVRTILKDIKFQLGDKSELLFPKGDSNGKI